MRSPYLDSLYQNVSFRVDARQKFTFSLQTPKMLSEYCKSLKLRSASIIIAENPMATICDWRDNARYRNSLISLFQIRYPEQIHTEVTALGVGKWPDESGLLFPNLTEDQARSFGVVYNQYAIIHWDDKNGVRLVHCL